MYVLTYSKDFDENNIDKNEILKLIQKHESHNLPKLIQNKKYYDAEHKIKNHKRRKNLPNSRVICNHAKDIADTASSYFMGNPITYKNTRQHDIEDLLIAFDNADTDNTDSDNALHMSIYGVAYEYVYAKQGELELSTKNLESEHTFIACDDTIEQRPLFAVYYYKRKDDITDKESYKATVLTQNLKWVLDIGDNNQSLIEVPEQHYMGEIPVVEYKNNKDCIGDFEQQISLIDAYNTLMSDRVNDKEQFIDALLILYGAQLGDDSEESLKAIKILREAGLLELPLDAKAEYLVQALDETGVEVLRKALKEDIYTFSHVPNLTDENFVGNSSGVAMEYKILGLEMITKTKTRYYKKGIHKRIKLFCHYLGFKVIETEANSIVANFSRSLPKNLLELAQIVTSLKGRVSHKTLLALLPFVEDPDSEISEVDAETEKEIKRQRSLFGEPGNDISGDSDEEE